MPGARSLKPRVIKGFKKVTYQGGNVTKATSKYGVLTLGTDKELSKWL
jgi:hypothetical protein